MIWAHWERLHFAIAALSFKKALVIGVFGGGTLGTLTGELLTNQWGAAGVSGIISATIMAVVLVSPRIMEQRRKGRETDAGINDGVTDQLRRYYEVMLNAAAEQVRYFQLIAAERDIIATIERDSKHDILDQLNNADFALKDCAWHMKHQAITADVPYTPKSYREMCSHRDGEIKECKRRIAQATPTIRYSPQAANPTN